MLAGARLSSRASEDDPPMAKQALKLSTFRIGEKHRRSEGLRLGTVRLLPRGIRAQDYARRDQFDLWFPVLAPSQALLRWFTAKPPSPQRYRMFAARYRKEMARGEPRQAIVLVAEMARRAPIAVGCYCHHPYCHRFALEQLIRQAPPVAKRAGR
jgi:uncharacterized protein YeaO (DUF488 family)